MAVAVPGGSTGLGGSVAFPAIDTMSERITSLIRRISGVQGRRVTYAIRQRSFTNATSGVLAENNPGRETLVVSVTNATTQRITTDPNSPSQAGIPIRVETSPLVLTREAFGELVTAEWYFSGFDGVGGANGVTLIERIRV